MQEVVKIDNMDLQVKLYNGQPVVTFKDIDTAHGRPEGTAKRNFNEHKEYFIENEDYFIINKSNVGTQFVLTYGFSNMAPRGTLLTEMGYLMIVKSLTDKKAWKVQRQLVNGYFRLMELTQQQPQQIETQVYTLNSHLQSQFLSVVEKRAKEAAIETVKEIMGDFKIQSPVINQTLNHPTPAIPTISQQVDIIRDTIRPLAEAFNDGSSGFNATFRKVYAAMGCDWKYRRTRYRNKKGNRNISSNFTLLESDKKLMKLYIDTVDRMLKEVGTSN